MTLGNRIAMYRKELELTQEGLAKRLEVTNQAVSKWESDVCCPDILLLPTIADIFGITLDELFGREERRAAPGVPWEDDGALRAVLYVGTKLAAGHEAGGTIHFRYEGPALNVHSEFSVACDMVGGNVTAGGSVTCDSVAGNVSAGGSVTCNDVAGSVDAGDSVTCNEVTGSVSAGRDVRCDSVEGNVSAGHDVHCDSVEGDVSAGANVTCEEINGDVIAASSVYCDHWEE